jgi:hypothetical protein
LRSIDARTRSRCAVDVTGDGSADAQPSCYYEVRGTSRSRTSRISLCRLGLDGRYPPAAGSSGRRRRRRGHMPQARGARTRWRRSSDFQLPTSNLGRSAACQLSAAASRQLPGRCLGPRCGPGAKKSGSAVRLGPYMAGVARSAPASHSRNNCNDFRLRLGMAGGRDGRRAPETAVAVATLAMAQSTAGLISVQLGLLRDVSFI